MMIGASDFAWPAAFVVRALAASSAVPARPRKPPSFFAAGLGGGDRLARPFADHAGLKLGDACRQRSRDDLVHLLVVHMTKEERRG
jgi:hypothetical protein